MAAFEPGDRVQFTPWPGSGRHLASFNPCEGYSSVLAAEGRVEVLRELAPAETTGNLRMFEVRSETTGAILHTYADELESEQ